MKITSTLMIALGIGILFLYFIFRDTGDNYKNPFAALSNPTPSNLPPGTLN